MDREQARAGIVRVCQELGFVSDETYTKIEELLDTVTADPAEEPDDEHDPMCTKCDHVCVRARRSPNPTGLIALGAEMCRFCDDHDEAVHEGYGAAPCDCPAHRESQTETAP